MASTQADSRDPACSGHSSASGSYVRLKRERVWLPRWPLSSGSGSLIGAVAPEAEVRKQAAS